MAGHSPFRVFIYACPASERPAAQAVVTSRGLRPDWGAEDDGGQLTLIFPYAAEELTADAGPDLCRALRKAAPGASFVMWQDPWTAGDPGDLIAYAPALGIFGGRCDGGGDVVLSFAEIWSVLSSPAGRADPAAALAHAAGEPWAEDYRRNHVTG
jgi:hypothetical protein